ncbi:diguanylate cyclase [Magnetospirillum sp. SS-4]|uniref:diguanylate cyclase n=1 Tax=Magnetospirillum sp. SS-4 TaxID=2681465 RepID=UPI00137FECDC|nr:diguanylate cyclase [Magnetospirillum sp. SS-4]CAA7614328.1 Diguanylate cyclase [Magnetospirillum sp. SS-4]
MHAEMPPLLQAEKIFSGLSDYQRALSGHMDWLRGWYSAILNWSDGGGQSDAATACPFEEWYEGASAGSALGGFAGFDLLGELHREIHQTADCITDRAVAGQTITTSDYEAMMALVLAFGTAAQNLEREAWRTLATVDPLTGLGNRQTMMTHLVSERDRAIRLKQPCCVGLVDIDHFKRINDTFGHATGDKVLRAVAESLRGAVRPYDILYRYGGEEFLVCLPAANLEAGIMVLERMRASLNVLAVADKAGTPIPVSATFGITLLSADLSVEESLEQADQALYDGKRQGRDRVTVYRGDQS